MERNNTNTSRLEPFVFTCGRISSCHGAASENHCTLLHTQPERYVLSNNKINNRNRSVRRTNWKNRPNEKMCEVIVELKWNRFSFSFSEFHRIRFLYEFKWQFFAFKYLQIIFSFTVNHLVIIGKLNDAWSTGHSMIFNLRWHEKYPTFFSEFTIQSCAIIKSRILLLSEYLGIFLWVQFDAVVSENWIQKITFKIMRELCHQFSFCDHTEHSFLAKTLSAEMCITEYRNDIIEYPEFVSHGSPATNKTQRQWKYCHCHKMASMSWNWITIGCPMDRYFRATASFIDCEMGSSDFFMGLVWKDVSIRNSLT